MKILFITDLYPIKDENVSKALFYIIQEWIKQGHSVEVIRSNFVINSIIRGRKIIKEKIYLDNNIKVYNLNYFTPFLFNVYNKLPKDFSLENYDVAISHMPCGALLAQKLLKKHKIKYIYGLHASDISVLVDFKYSFYFKNKLKQALLSADKIAARSPVLQNKIENIMPEVQDKTFVAYSGINDKIINEQLITKPFNDDKIKLVTASTLIKRKNIDILIKTLTLLDNQNINLTVIGDGKEKSKLIRLASKLNVLQKVKFTGRISREKVFEYFAKSDIFVLLSNNETFGLCYLEAMLTDNIIIAKKDDGIDGILLNNKNAFLIDAKPEELAKCINKILSMKDTDIELIRQNANETIKQLTLSSAAQSYIQNING